jgi:hypothetical protein
MKDFSQEIIKLYDRFLTGTPFSFSKYADGEWAMIQGKPIDNGEFNYTSEDEFFRSKLIESFCYRDERYYVGVSCPCCQGNEAYRMREFSGQDDNHLTFANIFVNNNHKFFVSHFIPEFQKRKIHLVANKKANIQALPFEVEAFYPVENTAWKYNYLLIEDILDQDWKDKLFLFACGPFGNMLAHQLWQNNKENTYLDIGSTLNLWLGSAGFHRCYLSEGSSHSNLVCTW